MTKINENRKKEKSGLSKYTYPAIHFAMMLENLLPKASTRYVIHNP